jgi:hypothetical protein
MIFTETDENRGSLTKSKHKESFYNMLPEGAEG